jgi:hypothetical protein
MVSYSDFMSGNKVNNLANKMSDLMSKANK